MKRELLYRDTAAAQSLVMLVLFFSAGLPWWRGRSIFEEMSKGAASGAIAMLHFGMPLVAAAMTLSRMLRGRVPQRASFWLLASQELFKTIAAVLAACVTLFRISRHRSEEMYAAGAVFLLAFLVLVSLFRGARREGWERWAHLLAMMTPWHLFVATGVLLENGNKHPGRGPWLYMLSSAALLPLMIWALWPHREPGEAPAPTDAPSAPSAR